MNQDRRESLEDLLEAIWLRQEAGKPFDPARYQPAGEGISVSELLGELDRQKLVEVSDGIARLTLTGQDRAAQIVRRHRLAERLFYDLLQTGTEDSTSLACRFEHILNEEVTEAVCTLLGHPPTCPHGREIPLGACCRRAEREVKPLVRPLSECAPGSQVRILFITPRFHERLDRLNSIGILPGAVVHLHQKQPAFVIRIDASEVAIEKEIAHEIFVIKIE